MYRHPWPIAIRWCGHNGGSGHELLEVKFFFQILLYEHKI